MLSLERWSTHINRLPHVHRPFHSLHRLLSREPGHGRCVLPGLLLPRESAEKLQLSLAKRMAYAPAPSWSFPCPQFVPRPLLDCTMGLLLKDARVMSAIVLLLALLAASANAGRLQGELVGLCLHRDPFLCVCDFLAPAHGCNPQQRVWVATCA